MPDQIEPTISCIFIAFVGHTLRFGHFIFDPMIPRQPEKLMLVICKRRYRGNREREKDRIFDTRIYRNTRSVSSACNVWLQRRYFLDNKNPCFMYVNKCRSVAFFFFLPLRRPALTSETKRIRFVLRLLRQLRLRCAKRFFFFLVPSRANLDYYTGRESRPLFTEKGYLRFLSRNRKSETNERKTCIPA